MLVLGDGKTIGTLGGGCVEAGGAGARRRGNDGGIGESNCLRSDGSITILAGTTASSAGGTMDIAVQVIGSTGALPVLERILETVSAGREASWVIDIIDEQSKPARF